MILKYKEISIKYVFFKRNGFDICVGIGYINGGCWIDNFNFRYIYECLLDNVYILIILVENMIEDE